MSRVLSDTMPPHLEVVATERRRLNAAFYANSVEAFLETPDDVVYAPLANPRGYTLALEQLSAERLQLSVLRVARRCIRRQRRGTERAGLMTSSSTRRLKPLAIVVLMNIDPGHWLLSRAKDRRLWLHLEDAATEFQLQGLEFEWTIVTWVADLRWSGDGRSCHSFREVKWIAVTNPKRRQYLNNAYRVLLTRNLEGMIIFVPLGAQTGEEKCYVNHERPASQPCSHAVTQPGRHAELLRILGARRSHGVASALAII